MKPLVLPCLCLALVGIPMSSGATTGASASVTGTDVDIAVSVAVDTNTAAFNYGFFDVYVPPLETVTRSFSYVVTVSDDGLPAFRVDNVCTPDYRSDCGPSPTGLEQAYALIEIGRDRRAVDDDNAFLDDANIVETFQSVTGMPRTYTGTLTYIATDTNQFLSQTAHLQIMLYVLADVAAVPEPAPWGTAVTGLACIALARLRSRRRTTTR
jgi:hypothetical protein